MTRIVLAGIILVAVGADAATDPTAKCQALKLKAAGQKTFGKVKCHQKAILKALPVDPVCLDKAEAKFTGSIAKADAAGTCGGTATALEAAVDAALANYLGIVTACGQGETFCGGSCVDTQIDELNCGACGNSCVVGADCQGGSCTAVCAPGDIDCSGICVDPNTDEQNCGGCGNACAIGEVCQNAMCVPVCAAGELDCSGTCVDPDTDEMNCGNCGVVCGVGAVCQDGSCTAVCAAGELDCSGTCVDPDTDEMNCGNCGVVCVVGETCVAGSCALP